MTTAVLVTALLAAGPSTTVAVTPAGTCAPRAVLERELRRAPVRFVDDDAELTIRLEAEPGGHRLRVTDLDGVPVMERLLPTAACDEAAVAAALIIDRALRDIVVRLPVFDGGVRTRRRQERPPEPPRPVAPAEPPKERPLEPPPERKPPRERPTRPSPPAITPEPPSTRPLEVREPTQETPPIPLPAPPPRDVKPVESPPIPRPAPPPPETAPPPPPRDVKPVEPPPPVRATPPPPPITDVASGALAPLPGLLVSAPRENDAPVEHQLRPDGVRFELVAGGGFSAPTPATLSLLLGLDAALHLTPRWRVGLLGAFSFGGSTPVVDEQGRSRGTLSGQTLFVLPHAMACLDLPIELCGGARAGLRLAAGTAAGPYIFQTRTVFAPAPTIGPGARATFAIGPLVLALDVTALVNPWTPALGVEGLVGSIETPPVEVLVQLSAGGRTR